MATYVNPLLNAALRGVERLSPAVEICLPVAYDAEGWAVWEIFQVGAVVEFGGKAWRLAGFTLDDEVILTPHGLGHSRPRVNWLTVEPSAIASLAAAEAPVRHRDGLVTFTG